MYKKKQDKESIDSYKPLGTRRVQAVRAKSSIEKMEDHFLVKEKILSAEEMKTIISNHELLNTLASYNDMASANAVTKLFEIARNYYEDDKHKGINELGAINDTKTTYLLNEKKLLKQKQLSFKDIDYVVGHELDKLCELIAGNSAILTFNNDQIHNIMTISKNELLEMSKEA